MPENESLQTVHLEEMLGELKLPSSYLHYRRINEFTAITIPVFTVGIVGSVAWQLLIENSMTTYARTMLCSILTFTSIAIVSLYKRKTLREQKTPEHCNNLELANFVYHQPPESQDRLAQEIHYLNNLSNKGHDVDGLLEDYYLPFPSNK